MVDKDVITNEERESGDEDEPFSHNNTIKEKVSVKHHIKHLPLLICNDQNEMQCSMSLKHHLKSILNFVSTRALDYDELSTTP